MIDTVTIGFSKPKNHIFPIGSWAIRLFQGTAYSHTYIRFYSESLNRTLVYEAVGTGGIRFIGQKMWLKHAEELESFTLKVKKCNATTMLQDFVDDCGLDYGHLQNIGIFMASLFGWKKNPWRKGKNCSEIVAKFLISEGYRISKPLDLVTPKDIYEILKN
jgi:hypothetical protein